MTHNRLRTIHPLKLSNTSLCFVSRSTSGQIVFSRGISFVRFFFFRKEISFSVQGATNGSFIYSRHYIDSWWNTLLAYPHGFFCSDSGFLCRRRVNPCVGLRRFVPCIHLNANLVRIPFPLTKMPVLGERMEWGVEVVGSG